MWKRSNIGFSHSASPPGMLQGSARAFKFAPELLPRFFVLLLKHKIKGVKMKKKLLLVTLIFMLLLSACASQSKNSAYDDYESPTSMPGYAPIPAEPEAGDEAGDEAETEAKTEAETES